MRFLVDMPISPAIAAWLRAQGYDAVHASDVGLFNSSDETILERAVQELRVVITADLDYPRLLALSDATGPGLVLFRAGSFNSQVKLGSGRGLRRGMRRGGGGRLLYWERLSR